ncbi:MAG: class I SAM-dependent methyltransferase [Rhizobiaceae bacterium]|nr:class I SAM-dependent methyltransferase [Rhizobiaceae bacterium]
MRLSTGFDRLRSYFSPVDPEQLCFLNQFPGAHLATASASSPRNQIGFIGRDPAKSLPARNVLGTTWPDDRAKPYKVVSFYTEDNEYKDHAARLQTSLERFGLPYSLSSKKSKGTWEFNCAYKAQFMREQWEQSDVPIVWLDADATVVADPVLFRSIDADFGIHKWEGMEFASGTLYFGKSPLAKRLIDQWAIRCEADPATYDQVHLHSAWCDINSIAPLKTIWLPRTYLDIFDKPVESGAVIRHWQASRSSKKDGRTTARERPSLNKSGHRARHANNLWRTSEVGFWITEGTDHIKPETGTEFPEGFDVGAALRAHLGDDRPFLEVGCGVGRIASLFAPEEYVGIDVNPRALKLARERLPNHDLRLHDEGYEYPAAATALFYTVLLHVSDADLGDVLKLAARSQRIVIAELMSRKWRRKTGRVPVFNRDASDYIQALSRLGFTLASETKHVYERYNSPEYEGYDPHLTILSFRASRTKAP